MKSGRCPTSGTSCSSGTAASVSTVEGGVVWPSVGGKGTLGAAQAPARSISSKAAPADPIRRCRPAAEKVRGRSMSEEAPATPAGAGQTSPHFSPMSRPASRPGVRSARSGPKSVSGNTVEARIACSRARGTRDAGGRLGATRRAAPSGRQCASKRLPDVPRRAGGARTRATRCTPLLPRRPDRAAQTMTLVRNAG